jgi:hypothetical protein
MTLPNSEESNAFEGEEEKRIETKQAAETK